MGIDCHATALIGLRIDRDALFTHERVRAFPHDYPPEFTHDPKSGRELWEDRDVPIPGCEEDDEGDLRLVGYEVVIGPDEESAYVALRDPVRTGSHRWREEFATVRGAIPLDMTAEFAKFRETMAGLGFWNDDNFGLWAMVDCG